MDERQKGRYAGAHRRRRYSARPFVITIAIITFLALVSVLSQRKAYKIQLPADSLTRRGVIVQDEECHLVHHASDKCAFIKANCPDEEAGIFSYLTLYYCRLPDAKPVAFCIMVLWLALLFSTIGIAASDFFCVNLSTIANLLGMSESMAGVTFLAFGNGSPDVFSTFAAMSTNSASLAIGELIGAACFITAVVAGSMALVRPFKVARKSFVRDVGFFIVAAGFSMGFISDGKLSLWESVTMVCFYLFYVGFVVVWHWLLNRRNARRRRLASMRSHYITPGGEEEEILQEYHDDDEGSVAESARTPMHNVSVEDFAALERAGEDRDALEGDDNEQVRERWLGELSSNMRISRPPLGERRNTHTPIRPSLVGALEFRAVLASLQKSRNIQSMPINLRRYSDDPTLASVQQQEAVSVATDPAPRPPFEVPQDYSGSSLQVSHPTLEVQRQLGNRARAVSTNDMDNAQLDPDAVFFGTVPSIDVGPASPEDERHAVSAVEHPPPSPTISLSPPPSQHTSRSASPAPSSVRHQFSDRLAPPTIDGPGLHSQDQGTPSHSPDSSPALSPQQQARRTYPKLVVPRPPSPTTPFPPYTDYPHSTRSSSRAPSLRLPSPSASPESLFPRDHFLGTAEQPKAPRWWPGRVLPPPNVLLGTLFPTLTNWRSKSIWEKLLGIVAATSVFLLTVTLPVVETQEETGKNNDDVSPTFSLPAALTPTTNGHHSTHQGGNSYFANVESGGSTGGHTPLPKHGSTVRTTTTDTVAPGSRAGPTITNADHILQSPEQMAATWSSSGPKDWNRWLVIIQAFLAPFFVALVVWANTDIEKPRSLLRLTMYSLIFSLVALALLLTTTAPTRPPRWRTMLCFMGFIVSIAWISTIANEVVGVLKAIGVILNMSDAILGLTIFAVGNSLGDLVADITVARLGFPVMALSACFGGPMLNILLGIGISGSYMTIKGSNKNHRQHPDRPIHFKPYHIDVSTTLVISGATLLATLVALLVAVPSRGWKMDKTIGWGLVAIWTASTIANVVVEILGVGSSVG